MLVRRRRGLGFSCWKAGGCERRGVVLRHRLARLSAVCDGFRSSGAVVVVNDASITTCDSASTLGCLGCSFRGGSFVMICEVLGAG